MTETEKFIKDNFKIIIGDRVRFKKCDLDHFPYDGRPWVIDSIELEDGQIVFRSKDSKKHKGCIWMSSVVVLSDGSIPDNDIMIEKI